jgi:hypothetical protein
MNEFSREGESWMSFKIVVKTNRNELEVEKDC